MKLLIVNPNTDVGATAAIGQEASRVASKDTQIVAVTAPAGPRVLVTPEDMQRAGPVVVEVIGAHHDIDAAISGAFSDPGLDAARSVFGFPIVGLREASFTEAAAFGRFTVIGTNPLSEPAYRQCAEAISVSDRLAAVRFVDAKGNYSDREWLLSRLIEKCRLVVEEDNIDAVVIAGGPLAGLARQVSEHVPVQIIDCVAAAVRQAERRVRERAELHA